MTGRTTRRFARLADYAGRGVITTATYEARALGVGSAMGLMKAATLAPEAILLPADFDAYRRASRAFKAAVRAIAPRVEDRGIDEIYIDLTGVRLPEHDDADDDPWWRARDVAKALKAAVREATGLGCSIAVAPNKLLAKIASELDKPDGLTMLPPHEMPRRIWPLPVTPDQWCRPEGGGAARGDGLRHDRRARARRTGTCSRRSSGITTRRGCWMPPTAATIDR